jgi:hypothetical protein
VQKIRARLTPFAAPGPAEILSRFRPLLLIFLAFALSVGVAACGDDGGGSDEDPQEVLDATFSPDHSIESGVIDFSLTIDAEGGNQPGTVEIGLDGPFDGGGEDVPRFDIDAEIKGETSDNDVDFSGGLTSTGDSAYVNFQGTDYAVPQGLFDQFAQSYVRLQSRDQNDRGGILEALNIRPQEWLTDLENEGTEDVEGTEAIHVSGSADVAKFFQDLQRLAERVGPAAGQLTPEQLAQAEKSVTAADFDIYSGAEDDILRRLTANLQLEPAEPAAGAPDSISAELSLTFGEVNESQEVSAPSDARPLRDLLQQFGLGAGQLGQGLQEGLGGGESGGSTAPPSSGQSQAYLQCLQTAQGADELSRCAELLQ